MSEVCTVEPIKVGQTAPDFSGQALMPDGSFKNISLSDYKGKYVVLFFYPLDFTFVCPTEIQSFNSNLSTFKDLNAEVISVSTDSAFTHKAWSEADLGKVEFPMLADTNHEVSKSYGVLIDAMGIALRGTFIIDPDGNLKSATVNDLPIGRSVDETIRTLQAIDTGELTQCGWKPGEKTLGKA